MNPEYGEQAKPESWPWRCQCGRINKKWAEECAVCYAHWTSGTEHPTQPKVEQRWAAYDWDEWSDHSRSSSRSSTRYQQGPKLKSKGAHAKGSAKQQGKGKKGKKGKKQGKGEEQPSPFQADSTGFASWSSMDASTFTPSSSLTPNPFATASSSSLVAEKQEWLDALRKAYPDPTAMPEDTKRLVEKTEREYGKRGIKNLHQASTYLGKVKDHLAEVTDKRRAHRSLWMKHLASGIRTWEQQLEEYRKHQASLAEQAAKARTEISAASRLIQQLSHTAGGTAAPAPIPNVEVEEQAEDAVDKEEDSLRNQLQAVLRNCASSLGLEMESTKVVDVTDVQQIEEEEATTDKPQKRPRSMEPFGGAS